MERNETITTTVVFLKGLLLLWNVYYHGVLRLRMPKGITLIAYADDRTIVTETRGETLWKQTGQSVGLICGCTTRDYV